MALMTSYGASHMKHDLNTNGTDGGDSRRLASRFSLSLRRNHGPEHDAQRIEKQAAKDRRKHAKMEKRRGGKLEMQSTRDLSSLSKEIGLQHESGLSGLEHKVEDQVHHVAEEMGSLANKIFSSLENTAKQVGMCKTILEYTVDPYSRFRMVWDTVMLTLVVYSCLTGAYDCAFYAESNSDMSWVEILVDISFYLDIFLNFYTGYDNGHEIITDKKEIAKNYVRGWFFLDLLATIEWDIVIGWFADDANDYRSARLMKIARLARASRLINGLTAEWAVHTVHIHAFQFFLYMTIFVHLLACFFYMWPRFSPALVDCSVEGGTKGTWAVDDDGNPKTPVKMREEYQWDDTCIPGSWRDKYGLHTMLPMEAYVQALYWSVTTITTIGYGDLSPAIENDIKFTFFCFLIGLGFYAVMLEEINKVNDVLSARHDKKAAIKNTIVQQMKWNNMDTMLIDEIVRFLSFRSTCLVSKMPEMVEMKYLSTPLQNKLYVNLLKPVLCRVRYFGWSENDILEEAGMKDIFDSMDEDLSGYLCEEELTVLCNACGMHLTPAQMHDAMCEMDTSDDHRVHFLEFREWWYFQKHGAPIPERCPQKFLDDLCCFVQPECAGPHENLIDGDYGHRMIIVLVGKVHVFKRTDAKDHDKNWHMSLSERKLHVADIADDSNLEWIRKIVGEVDADTTTASGESIVGLQCVLEDPIEFEAVREKTQHYVVKTDTYADMLSVGGRDLRDCMSSMWPQGIKRMRKLALARYEINPKTLDRTPDPVIDPLEELDAMDERLGSLDAKMETLKPLLQKMFQK